MPQLLAQCGNGLAAVVTMIEEGTMYEIAILVAVICGIGGNPSVCEEQVVYSGRYDLAFTISVCRQNIPRLMVGYVSQNSRYEGKNITATCSTLQEYDHRERGV